MGVTRSIGKQETAAVKLPVNVLNRAHRVHMNEAYVAITQANYSQWKQVSSHSLIPCVKIDYEARHVTFPPLEVCSDIHLLAARNATQTKVHGWTSAELTHGLSRRLHVGVDRLEQVVVIKVQDKLFKVLKRLPMRGRAMALGHVLVWGANASWGTRSTFRTMVVRAPFLIGASFLLLVLAPNVCHLHRRYVLLASSLRVDALLIQGFQHRNAVAHPGSHSCDPTSALPYPLLCHSGRAKEPATANQHWKFGFKINR